jgi:uroporphyrinogen-III synthase
MPFDGLRVLSLESRRAREMHTLICREGGVPFVAPSVKERSVAGAEIALSFVDRLERGDFDMVICMTAVGLAFLRDACVPRMPVERISAALRRAAIVSRGPKPVGVLRQLGVPVAVMVPEPNTWREIVDAVATRPERRIAVQEYGRPGTAMSTALEQLGASVTPFALYRWELPDDLGPLREAVARICNGACDVVLFTSSVQLDHLLTVARMMNVEQEVRTALTRRLLVASIGPVMSEALEAEGIAPDIVPRSPKMWALVKAAAGTFSTAAVKERRSSF